MNWLLIGQDLGRSAAGVSYLRLGKLCRLLSQGGNLALLCIPSIILVSESPDSCDGSIDV